MGHQPWVRRPFPQRLPAHRALAPPPFPSRTQVWITPDRRGHEPQYGSSTYDKAERHNKLLHILGGTGAVPEWPAVNRGRCIALHQVGRGAAPGVPAFG